MNNKLINKIFLSKIFFLLTILFSTNQAYSNGILSQMSQKMITLDMQNREFIEILNEIRKISGLNFVYNEKDVSSSVKKTITVKNESVENVLSLLLNDTDLQYSITNNSIIIEKKIQKPTAQNDVEKVTIKGKIVEAESGLPIVGATVIIANSTDGAITDNKGMFVISAAIGAEFEINYVGRETLKGHFIKNEENRIIELKLDDMAIDDIVVTGIFEHRQGSFTGAATTITGEELKRVGSQNVIASLRNIDPSVMIFDDLENGSDPNKTPEMNLRGDSSIDLDVEDTDIAGTYGNDPNAPLFILDGFETTIQKIIDLDMERVESMTILKDASAKAIYGSKASNGVIVIETIKPTGTDLRISYNASVDISFPDLTSYNLTNAAQKLELEVLAGLYHDDDYNKQLDLNREYYNKYSAIVAGIDTDWLAKPLRTGVGTKHTLSLELGSKDLTVLGNFSYNAIAGTMIGSSRDTYSGSINIGYRHKRFLFRNILEVDSNVATDSPYGTFSEYANMNPYYSPYDYEGRLIQDAALSLRGMESGDVPVAANPLYNSNLSTLKEKRYIEMSNKFNVDWFIMTGLKATARFGITEKRTTADEFYPSNHTRFMTRELEDRGSYKMNNGTSKDLTGDILLRFNKGFGQHYISANAGYNIDESTFDEVYYTAVGFPSDRMNDIMFAREFLEDSKPMGREATIREFGVVSAFNYSYKSRYLFDASYRTGASSQYGANSDWGKFWSVGTGWNIHREDFIKNLAPKITNFKLRASVGHTGAQSRAAYASLATYEYEMERTYTNFMGAYLVGMENDGLKWQHTMDYNIGVDFNFNKRFIFVFDIYNKITENTLVDLTLPPSTGFETVKENVGKISNKGFDARVTWIALQNTKEDTFLSFTASVSRNVNTIEDISEAMRDYNAAQEEMVNNEFAEGTPAQMYVDGVSMNAIWAMSSLGIDPANGQEIYLTANGVPTYTYAAAEQVVQGDKMPDFHGNFGINVGYKGFDANLSFRFQYGAQLYNSTLIRKVETANMKNNVDARMYDGIWKKPGDVVPYRTIAEVWVSEEQAYMMPQTRPTSRFVQDRNEFSLSNIMLSYDFYRFAFVKKYGLERLQLKFNMRDVFMISSIDVERGTSYPFARGFNFALNVTF